MLIQPRPDETTYSLLARAHVQIGIQNPSASLLQLTGKKGFKPLSGLPTCSQEIIRRAGLSISIDDWINDHTLFPLYRPFLPPERIEYVRASIVEGGATKSRLGLLRSHCGAAEQLAFCPRCIELSVCHFGHSYWTRGHQVVGARICTKHGLPLHTISTKELPWSSRALVLPAAGREMQVKERQKEQLTFIAQQLGEIISSKTNATIGHDLYVDVLRSAGLYTAKGRIRGRRLTAAVRRWLAPLRQTRPFESLLSALSVERNWATTTVACDGGFTNPMKHIVVWGAIGCKWSDLINAASARGHQMELKLRFASSTPPSDSVAIETLRRVGTLTAAASELGCDVTTMAVWADKLGWNRKRKPKKVTSELRFELTEAITNGGSSSELAQRFNVSVSTINRVKRALRS